MLACPRLVCRAPSPAPCARWRPTAPPVGGGLSPLSAARRLGRLVPGGARRGLRGLRPRLAGGRPRGASRSRRRWRAASRPCAWRSGSRSRPARCWPCWKGRSSAPGWRRSGPDRRGSSGRAPPCASRSPPDRRSARTAAGLPGWGRGDALEAPRGRGRGAPGRAGSRRQARLLASGLVPPRRRSAPGPRPSSAGPPWRRCAGPWPARLRREEHPERAARRHRRARARARPAREPGERAPEAAVRRLERDLELRTTPRADRRPDRTDRPRPGRIGRGRGRAARLGGAAGRDQGDRRVPAGFALGPHPTRASGRGSSSRASPRHSTASCPPPSPGWPASRATGASASNSRSAGPPLPPAAATRAAGHRRGRGRAGQPGRARPAHGRQGFRAARSGRAPAVRGGTAVSPVSPRRAAFLAPEVVQTSAMDCGPAALKCLLEGFGIPISYGRLREACQTDVDGTSIDTLEEMASISASTPSRSWSRVDHLLVPEARSLPAIVVVRHPVGLTHFVVVWRRHGRWLQVMDPATGRRWTGLRQFLDEVYLHRMPVPAAGWREWAGSEEFQAPLRARLRNLGITRDEGGQLIGEALAVPDWRSLAALDAGTRMTQSLIGSGAIARGREAGRLLRSLLARCREHPGNEESVVPVAWWSVRPAPPMRIRKSRSRCSSAAPCWSARGAAVRRLRRRRFRQTSPPSWPPLSASLLAAGPRAVAHVDRGRPLAPGAIALVLWWRGSAWWWRRCSSVRSSTSGANSGSAARGSGRSAC